MSWGVRNPRPRTSKIWLIISQKVFFYLSNFIDIHSSDPTLPFNVGFYNLLL